MTDRNTGTRIDAPLTIFGTDDIPAGYTDQLQGAVQQFKDKAGMKAWSDNYKSRVFNSIAIVGKGENNYPSIYHWTGTKEDGSDGSWEFAGYFGGVVLADADGAIPALRATIVLGEDFAIQQAGDNGLGVLVQLSDKIKQAIASGGGGASLSVIAPGPDGVTYNNIDSIKLGQNLEINTVMEQHPQSKRAVLDVKPGVFEAHHNEGYMAYFDENEVITGALVTDKREGAIWPMKVAWGGGNVDIYPELDTKSVTLQDPYNDDPSVSGGVPIFCGLHIGFYGSAHEDGLIEFLLWDDNRDEMLSDASGNPIGYVHHFKSGDKLKPITIGSVYMAKGAVKAQWRCKHTFHNDPIRFKDWAADSSCMIYQILGKDESVSPALNEFQEAIQKPVRIMQKYYGRNFLSNKWEMSFSRPEALINPGQGEDSPMGIDFENTTILKASLSNSTMTIKDDGTHMVLFNVGIELTPEDTRNLRGKEVTVSTQVIDRYNATNLAMFVYKGEMADVPHPILTGYQNMQYILSSGWELKDKKYLSEDYTGQFHSMLKIFTIPDDAEVVMFGLLPLTEQSPCDISFKPMAIDVDDPFTSFDVSIPKTSEEFSYNTVTSTYVTYPKQWVINKTDTNLPFGEKPKGTPAADVELSVDSDTASAYDGGIMFKAIAEYTIEIWLSVSNLQKTHLTENELVKFWVEDEFGTIIADSTAPDLTLADGDNAFHIVHWSFPFNNTTENTILKLYGKGKIGGIAFLSQGSDNAAGVVISQKVVA